MVVLLLLLHYKAESGQRTYPPFDHSGRIDWSGSSGRRPACSDNLLVGLD